MARIRSATPVPVPSGPQKVVKQMNNAGDLGRRVAERRHELGLSVEQVASRSGMSPTYLHFVEAMPSPQLSIAALWRLASALETTVDGISGGGLNVPSGRGQPRGQAALEPLSIDECRALVAPGGVGRLVFSDSRGPVALPVNYRVLDGDIVFRTQPEATFVANTANGVVSFEVDHLDEAMTEGWSVLLTGELRVLVDPTEIEAARNLEITPWAGGERGTFVRVLPRHVTGRRIRQSSGHG